MTTPYRVRWAGGLRFIGSTARGHSTVMDGDSEVAMTPMDMLLLGTGACAAIDLVMILKKGREQLVHAEVELRGERRDEMPRYFTDVTLHFVVSGRALSPAKVERAIALAMEKYCSASAQLAALADIRTSFEVQEAELPA